MYFNEAISSEYCSENEISWTMNDDDHAKSYLKLIKLNKVSLGNWMVWGETPNLSMRRFSWKLLSHSIIYVIVNYIIHTS